MRNACVVLRERSIDDITANDERLRYFVEHSIGVVTALVPAIGYERATQIAKEALDSGRGVYDIVREKGLLTKQELDRLLNPEAMTGGGANPAA
jgi:aspartate ammonia-lyase